MVRFMMFQLGLGDSTTGYSLFRMRRILAEPPINRISLVMNFVQRAESDPAGGACIVYSERRLFVRDRSEPVRGIDGGTRDVRDRNGRQFEERFVVADIFVGHLLAAQLPRQQHRPEKY